MYMCIAQHVHVNETTNNLNNVLWKTAVTPEISIDHFFSYALPCIFGQRQMEFDNTKNPVTVHVNILSDSATIENSF